ncbi:MULTISPECIES: SirB2 family protein [Tatumella]|uniref:SirB2 family protein n=1 Tax=Tatumella punctata TaxID=399969 RepID=A0ABW1VTT3_9GAMM|nr:MULTISPECIES: SirB2 family protein [unclassified Tatumella]MBS0854991.1 SirB2 family protein [Tatumella sp. JGM16]MBS0876022.1 SirB2 family protein [Tatumella sp. JGM82]MBS0890496.1 SirB2 family protein [Tatumella sp. JGM94]MBS0892606.1 SirB2 family protein [Tatumella sp. JGM130]MBS0900952.1 SirB2 family protein [Tatumella sp. JGM100]
MNNYFTVIKSIHIFTAIVSVLLFTGRFYWKTAGSAMMQRRWVKITPHINDTLLLLTGIMLVLITRYYPFTADGSWLTEKLMAVILYIGFGFVAFGRRNFSPFIRGIAFCAALLMLVIIVFLAINRIPLVGML